MKIKRFIALDSVDNESYFLVNYINGKRYFDIPVKDPKCLKDCIVYLEEEIEIIKKYHPEIIVLPYTKSNSLSFFNLKKGRLKYRDNKWFVCNERNYEIRIPLYFENENEDIEIDRSADFYNEQKVSIQIILIPDENGVGKPYAKIIKEKEKEETLQINIY